MILLNKNEYEKIYYYYHIKSCFFEYIFTGWKQQIVDYGLIRIQGNVALGKPLAFNGTNIYWVGDLDIYSRDNIPISTGIYYFAGSFGGDQRFNANHMAFLGASYHFKTNNHVDPYFGILPDMLFVSLTVHFLILPTISEIC